MDFETTLSKAASGDAHSLKSISEQIYNELRQLARARMRRTPADDTLQPTALVNEAYMRMLGKKEQQWDNRRHFFAAAGQAMRDILVERARKKARPKHGGDRKRADFDVAELSNEPQPEEVLAIDDALKQLEAADARSAEVVVLRYYAGLSEEQIAMALDVNKRTVRRDWAFARSWLQQKLAADDSE